MRIPGTHVDTLQVFRHGRTWTLVPGIYWDLLFYDEEGNFPACDRVLLD